MITEDSHRPTRREIETLDPREAAADYIDALEADRAELGDALEALLGCLDETAPPSGDWEIQDTAKAALIVHTARTLLARIREGEKNEM